MNGPQQLRLTPLGKWETETVNIPDGGNYDTELGPRMTHGAIRVSNDEPSDKAFHEKYHETVVAEFGENARPTEPRGLDE